MESMTIGRVAKAAGVGVETVRFYEREGLIPEPPRRASGYRQYPPATVRRLVFIRRAKELGFTLRQIGQLLGLRVHPDQACGPVRQAAEAKIVEVQQRIDDLQRIKTVLLDLVEACGDERETSDCPILRALDGGKA